MEKPPLTILLASPRGYCAGVERAILIVEKALEKYGAPVYVRHEIVHNRFVVQELEARGAVFVDELDEVPTGMPVIFSAHGVPKAVPAEAERRKMFYLDATCPLVSKVHREAEQQAEAGRHIVLIGHAGHPEVIGTVGQLPDGAMSLVQTVADAEAFAPPPGAARQGLAYITQTTLSVDETAEIVAVLQRRFPDLVSPRKEDICYATTNRQHAVRAIAPRCDHVLVIGAPNSSNSLRLVEQARRAGCAAATLVQRATDIPWDQLGRIRTIGISAGASAPEKLVTEVIDALRERFAVSVESQPVANENITFKLPRALEA